MQIYGLANCDTCRKARRALPEATFVDVRAEGIPPDVLDAALAEFDAALLNTRSTTWRGLDAAQRARPLKTLLESYPALMKRPLIVTADAMHLGWNPQVNRAGFAGG